MKSILLLGICFLAPAQISSRAQLYQALLDGKVLDPDRQLVHFSHTCTLRIDGGDYPVIDVQELVKGSGSPRGVNRIVVLNPELKPVRKIDYTTERPLFCAENRLFVFGDLEIGNVGPEGNALTFSNHAQSLKVSHVGAGDYPVPITRQRKSPPQ